MKLSGYPITYQRFITKYKKTYLNDICKVL